MFSFFSISRITHSLHSVFFSLFFYFSTFLCLFPLGHYVFLLGAYRALYIINWIYRSYHELHYKHNWVVYICGIIQTCLYVDFFYYYIQRYDNIQLHSSAFILIFSYFFSEITCCLHFLLLLPSASFVSSLLFNEKSMHFESSYI